MYHQPYHYPIGNTQNSLMYNGNNFSRQHFNIPFLPILGNQSFQSIINSIYKAIVDEAIASDFYSRLLKEVPDELHREFVKHAYEDEIEHLEAFTKLYVSFTGQEPQYHVKLVQYPNYKAGILRALKDELEAAEFYRDVILSNTDQLVKDTFLFAMVDELEHSTQFGVLYNTL